MQGMTRALCWTVLLAWLAGCTTVPEAIRGTADPATDPAQVRGTPESYQGTPVRWGGVIAAVTNRAEESVVEVVSRPLGSSGRPQETDQTAGRFLVRVAGFLDPAVYAAGREFTVVGTIEGSERRNIGEYPYTYPVVRATGHYLWPPREEAPRDPFYYPPFYRPYYDPWYPYGPYPY